MKYSKLIGALAALSLANCSAKVDDQAANSDNPSQPTTAELAEDTSVPDMQEPMTPSVDSDAVSSPDKAGETTAKRFPVAFQGRWGLVPADCMSRMGDTKGLAVFSADEIRFYESIGAIKVARTLNDRTFAGTLSYEGEGMQWDREASISVAPDGEQLVLEEFGADAVPGPRTYRKC